ncbi:hypothetical protein FACS1894185_3410 [Betaproteobacteria bacterium]|nr:hypothetical protein FACS1894185_3410 [Betaproteobacteria bacterium]
MAGVAAASGATTPPQRLLAKRMGTRMTCETPTVFVGGAGGVSPSQGGQGGSPASLAVLNAQSGGAGGGAMK